MDTCKHGNTGTCDLCDYDDAEHDAAMAAQIEDELAALRKDAERYRWLRQDECIADWDAAGVLELYAGPDYSRKNGESLDAAIDAAMAPKRDGAA